MLTARAAVGDEPFAVFFPDDLILSDVPTIGSMIDLFNEHGRSVVAVEEVPDELVPSKGIVDARPVGGGVFEIAGLVEKPTAAEAPSNLAIVGRYVLTPEVFDALESVEPGTGGEIWLTDAISMLLDTQGAYAYKFPGTLFDVGTPLGLQMASVYAALQRDDVGPSLRSWLRTVL